MSPLYRQVFGGTLAALFAAHAPALAQQCPGEGDGVPEIVSGGLYRVWSDESDAANCEVGENIVRQSGMFVILGEEVASGTWVYVFGTGYGDPGGDICEYLPDLAPTRSASQDADRVADVIEFCLGLTSSEAKITYIVPHGHLDHINAEFITEMTSAQLYPIGQIIYHEQEEPLVTNELACAGFCPGFGGLSCDSSEDCPKFFGSPFDAEWSAGQENRFVVLEAVSDCAVLETLAIGFDPFEMDIKQGKPENPSAPHTPGPLDIFISPASDDSHDGVILYDSEKGCSTPAGYAWFKQHPGQGPNCFDGE